MWSLGNCLVSLTPNQARAVGNDSQGFVGGFWLNVMKDHHKKSKEESVRLTVHHSQEGWMEEPEAAVLMASTVRR